MLSLILRAAILYLVAIVAVRLMGKKQISELQPSELVTTIIISGIVTMSLEESNISLMAGILPIILIVCLDIIITGLNLKSHFLRRLTTGTPDVIISNGVLDQNKLRALRYTLDDILETMRQEGIFELAQIQFAIVENTGKISFFPKTDAATIDPQAVIIKDGKLDKAGLAQSGQSRDWLRTLLNEKRLCEKDVFLLMADSAGNYELVERA
ncbi:MAG: DUF421 domain-containing protein [Oscillospiraceae bacterium]|nr:DUF421 domain-containing protein [Oscillospiraceae bacterium]